MRCGRIVSVNHRSAYSAKAAAKHQARADVRTFIAGKLGGRPCEKYEGDLDLAVTVDLYGHFVPGADRHRVEGLADAIQTAEAHPAATPRNRKPLPGRPIASKSLL